MPLQIQVGTVRIPVLCHAGNLVFSSQLQKRRNYPIIYGNQNPAYANGQFVIQGKICPKAATIPAVTKEK